MSPRTSAGSMSAGPRLTTSTSLGPSPTSLSARNVKNSDVLRGGIPTFLPLRSLSAEMLSRAEIMIESVSCSIGASTIASSTCNKLIVGKSHPARKSARPPRNAADAAPPLSNSLTVALTPCFLKKPFASAMNSGAKCGNGPEKAVMALPWSALPCPGHASVVINARATSPISTRLQIMIVPFPVRPFGLVAVLDLHTALGSLHFFLQHCLELIVETHEVSVGRAAWHRHVHPELPAHGAARAEHDHAGAEQQGLDQIVRDEDDRLAGLRPQADELLLEIAPRDR